MDAKRRGEQTLRAAEGGREKSSLAQSLYHDHVPAKAAGMTCVWIDRQNLSSGGNWGATAAVEQWPEVDAVFADLASFADAALGV